mmetsp:Transcript_10776/g.21406  ORF Transcript_10776/g.21406 Transcript_10776/m.21406 type:complete len:400 (-) Transcript_10776:688-1887(-)
MRVSLPRLPNLYLGTMTFGWKGQTSSLVDDAIASQMVNTFANLYNENDDPLIRIDTARIYAGGDSEKMLGLTLNTHRAPSTTPGQVEGESKKLPHMFSIGTKAHPSQPKGLSQEGLRTQLQSSLEAMNLSAVNEFYLHQPDENHSLLDSLKTLHQFVQEGLIASIGMSNYHASEVQRAFDLCDQYDLTKPSVYQGLYNPLNRCVEDELLPVLRANGCKFVAYNPLAGGMLTGKHIGGSEGGGDEVKEGRFKNNPNYLPRFYTPSNFKALQIIQSACEENDISMVEGTYRWLLRHSALRAGESGSDGGDGILLGVSSMEQLEENLKCCLRAKDDVVTDKGGEASGKLPQSVVKAFDEAWDIIQNDPSSSGPFPYWRSYSADMPGKESLDPGASYNANKTK